MFLSEPLLFLILTSIFIFTQDISVQNIGYRSTWYVIVIGISISTEKYISVEPYYRFEDE